MALVERKSIISTVGTWRIVRLKIKIVYLYRMIRDIDQFQTQQFLDLCITHRVKELYVFGSVARGTDTKNSDVDLLVEVDEDDPIIRGSLLLSLYDKLSIYFNKKVDLLTEDSLRNPLLKEAIRESKTIVYRRGIL